MYRSETIVASGLLVSRPDIHVGVTILEGGSCTVHVTGYGDEVIRWRCNVTPEDARGLLALCERDDGVVAEYQPSTSDEIERKFIASWDFMPHSVKMIEIEQGYISSNPACTVRVRIKNGIGEFTVKGPGSASGASRFEWEAPEGLPVETARTMFHYCEPGFVHKQRHHVKEGEHLFEVDVLLGRNEGLPPLAEVELDSEDEAFVRPAWLLKEVTGDPRFYNSVLARHPYQDWSEEERVI